MGRNYILERIRITRERLKVSQKEIADQLGITQSTYSKKESEPSRLSIEELFVIAEFLKVSVSYLTSSEEDWSKTEALIQKTEDSNKQKIWDQSSEIGQLKIKISRLVVQYQQEMQERHEDYLALIKEKSNMLTKHINEKDEWHNIRLNLYDQLKKVERDLSDAESKLRRLSNLAKDLEKAMINDMLDFLTLSNVISLFQKVEGVNLNLNNMDLEKTELVLKRFREGFNEYSRDFQVRLEELKIVKD